MKICFITKNKGGIPFKCGGGFCGTCRCKIENGKQNLASPTKKEIKILSKNEFDDDIRLACQTIVNGPVSVSWIPLELRKK